MATRAIKVLVEGDATKLGKTTKEAVAHVSKMNAAIAGFAAAGAMKVFDMAADAVQNFTSQLGAAGEAFRADEVSQAKLANVMKNIYGPDYKHMIDATEEFASAQARLGFQDDDVRDSLGKLVGVTKNMREAMDDVALAQDLARAKGMDLAAATDIIAKAQQGNGKALKSLGIDIGKAKTAAELLDAVQKNVKGSAEAWSKTSEGKLAAANVKNAESWERIGKIVNQVQSVVLPLAAEAFERISNFVISNLVPAFNQIWAVAKQIWTAFMGLLAPAIQYIKDHFEELKPVLYVVGGIALLALGLIVGAILVVIAAVVLLVAGFIMFKNNIEQILNNAVKLWIDFENRLIGGVRNVVNALNQIPGVKIALPALQGYGGSAQTGGGGRGVQSFDSGGTVQGDYLGQKVMVQAQVGEHFSKGGRGGGGDVHIHIDQGAYIDGPSIDMLAQRVAQRIRVAPGT